MIKYSDPKGFEFSNLFQCIPLQTNWRYGMTFETSTRKKIQVAMICDPRRFSEEQLELFHKWYVSGFGFNTQILLSFAQSPTSIVDSLLNFPNYVLMEDQKLEPDSNSVLKMVKEFLLSPNLDDETKLFFHGPEVDQQMCIALLTDPDLSDLDLTVIPISVEEISDEMGMPTLEYFPQSLDYTFCAEFNTPLDVDWHMNTRFQPEYDTIQTPTFATV
jgi:hypothetical protein